MQGIRGRSGSIIHVPARNGPSDWRMKYGGRKETDDGYYWGQCINAEIADHHWREMHLNFFSREQGAVIGRNGSPGMSTNLSSRIIFRI